jgi:hypothetical protein
MKDTETKKAVSMTTTIAIAILATALVFPTLTTVAIAQSSGNDFQEFMECLFNDVGGSTATAQDIEDVLQGNSADVTEQEIRDCFSPIYNDASGASSGSGSSNDDDSAGTSDSNNNSDDEEDNTEETDNTENTDNTQGGDTTEVTDSTDSADTNEGTEDTTTGNPDDSDSITDSTDSSPQ